MRRRSNRSTRATGRTGRNSGRISLFSSLRSSPFNWSNAVLKRKRITTRNSMPCASAWRRRAPIRGPAIERLSYRGSPEDRSVGMWSIASYNRDVSKGDLLPAARGLDSQTGAISRHGSAVRSPGGRLSMTIKTPARTRDHRRSTISRHPWSGGLAMTGRSDCAGRMAGTAFDASSNRRWSPALRIPSPVDSQAPA